MFHLSAYTELLGTTANTDIDALADQIMVIQNNHFLPQRDYNLIFAWAASATLNRARIVSPTARNVTLPFIRPINVAALPATDPNVADYSSNPFRVRGLEELAIEATSDIAMGTERFTALIGLETERVPVPRGDIYTIRGTSTTAATANAWSDITVTWADLLSQGEYAVIGMETQSTNGQASRLIFEDQTMRPGSISVSALANRTHKLFYKGALGVWGYMRSYRFPNVQVLANAADASHTVYMDLVRVR